MCTYVYTAHFNPQPSTLSLQCCKSVTTGPNPEPRTPKRHALNPKPYTPCLSEAFYILFPLPPPLLPSSPTPCPFLRPLLPLSFTLPPLWSGPPEPRDSVRDSSDGGPCGGGLGWKPWLGSSRSRYPGLNGSQRPTLYTRCPKPYSLYTRRYTPPALIPTRRYRLNPYILHPLPYPLLPPLDL
jgi:hypothetical protein